jgi:hypothetical protein
MNKLFHNPLMTFCLVLFFAFSSCKKQSEKEIETIYASLKDGEAKAIVMIDDTPFYPKESVFKGDIEVFPTSFRLNLTDQFEGNVVIALTDEKWYANRPIIRPVLSDNPIASSVMVGKIKDKIQRTGIGYLMTNGEIKIEQLSKAISVIHLKGKIARYQDQQEPTQWNEISALIVYKKPKLVMQSLPNGKSIL